MSESVERSQRDFNFTAKELFSCLGPLKGELIPRPMALQTLFTRVNNWNHMFLEQEMFFWTQTHFRWEIIWFFNCFVKFLRIFWNPCFIFFTNKFRLKAGGMSKPFNILPSVSYTVNKTVKFTRWATEFELMNARQFKVSAFSLLQNGSLLLPPNLTSKPNPVVFYYPNLT